MEPGVIWYLTDGKRGHENQTLGLIDALARRRRSIEVHAIDVPPKFVALGWWMTKRFPPGNNLPRPQWIIAAGHATHLPLLAAGRASGGRTIVLMKPSLPVGWFDLCICPEHDGLPAGEHVLLTAGVLNRIRPQEAAGADERDARGLILIGGPSSHHGWDDRAMVGQVREIVSRTPERMWTLTTSRRTPATFLPALCQVRADNLSVVPLDQTDGEWLPRQLDQCGAVFVSEDSVSMVYEAVTSGAAVALLPVPRLGTSRVIDGVDRLVAEGRVIPYATWKHAGFSDEQPAPLDEADRCAAWIETRWGR